MEEANASRSTGGRTKPHSSPAPGVDAAPCLRAPGQPRASRPGPTLSGSCRNPAIRAPVCRVLFGSGVEETPPGCPRPRAGPGPRCCTAPNPPARCPFCKAAATLGGSLTRQLGPAASPVRCRRGCVGPVETEPRGCAASQPARRHRPGLKLRRPRRPRHVFSNAHEPRGRRRRRCGPGCARGDRGHPGGPST